MRQMNTLIFITLFIGDMSFAITTALLVGLYRRR